jgi:hypothetical protein
MDHILQRVCFCVSNLEYNIKMTLDDLEILIYYSPYIKIFYYESRMSIGGATWIWPKVIKSNFQNRFSRVREKLLKSNYAT